MNGAYFELFGALGIDWTATPSRFLLVFVFFYSVCTGGLLQPGPALCEAHASTSVLQGLCCNLRLRCGPFSRLSDSEIPSQRHAILLEGIPGQTTCKIMLTTLESKALSNSRIHPSQNPGLVSKVLYVLVSYILGP